MKRTILFLFLSVLVTSIATAQEIVVKGTVTDKTNGELLPGANVIVDGTTVGATTDFDGNYAINAPSDGVLVFSFMGMKTVKVPVNGQATINVALDYESEILNDVIVVAYGTTTKEAFTGAAEVVNKDVIADRPVTSFEKALQGTTAGLQVTNSSGQPGSSATVRIRGIGSLNASSSPLYVIDGIPMAGSLSDINPNDIESLTVLKDAAAASLYGSRAANGVILITTKQAKEGQTQITFDANYGVSSRISDGYALMNATQIYEQQWMGLYNRQVLDGFPNTDAIAFAHTNVENVVGFNPFGVAQPLDDNGRLIPGTIVKTNTDWRDEVYKTGAVQNYNLSVAGGTSATKVFFSLGYFNDSGTTLNSNFKRYTAKLNASQKVNKFITAGMNTHFSMSETNAPPSGGEAANPIRMAELINAATPVYNDDGTYNWDNSAQFDFNPVGLADLDKYEYKGSRALVNTYVNVEILPNLNFKTNGAIDYAVNKGLNYYNPFHGNGAGVGGRSTQSRSDNIAWNISNILTWVKDFDNSNLELLAGQEAVGEEFTVLSAGVTDFAVPGNPELVWGGTPTTPSSSVSDWTMVSYLGQAKYAHAGKYYLSGSVRSDGSSRFGVNNRYGLFYSIGGSWRMTKEEWMSDIGWLNNFKLRASYGTSGNNNIGNYASLGLYGGGANYGGYPGITPVQPENKELAWEKIASLNIGFESTLFNTVDFSFEYYNRDSDKLLFAKPLSSGTGYGSILTNLGAMSNRGFESNIAWDAVNKENFTYSVGLNVSTNKNIIKNLETDQIISGTKILEVDGDVYQFYMRDWAGVNPDNGMPMWYANQDADDDSGATPQPGDIYDNPLGGDRQVTSDYSVAKRVRMGSALPDVFGGFTNNFRYKNFDLNFYFYYSLGGQVYNNDYATNMHDGSQVGYNLAADAIDAWTPNNRFTDVPRYVFSNTDQGSQLSSRFLEDASYLRLKNISLSYNLPDNLAQKMMMQNFRLSVSAENIWTLSKFNGFDPEGAINGTTGNSIPGVKVVNVGLKANF